MQHLRRIIQEFNSANDIDEALLIMVQRIREALDTNACSVYLIDPKSSEFALIATRGLSVQSVGHVRVPTSVGLIGQIGHRKQPLNVPDQSAVSAFTPIEGLGEEQYRGFLGAPVMHQGRLLGVIVLQKQDEEAFADQEEAFLITLSAQVAETIALAIKSGRITQFAATDEKQQEMMYTGVPSSAGVGIGTGIIIYPLADLKAVPERECDDVDEEIGLFRESLKAIREEIKMLSKRLATNLSPEDHALFDAYLTMLDENGIGIEVEQEIRKGQWAQGALSKVIKMHVRQFESMENEYLRERGDDVRDLGLRILAHMQEQKKQMPQEYPKKVILIGGEISAANLAEVPLENLAGIISGKGSSNSHVAILARALGIPAVMGVEDLTLNIPENQPVIVDGYYGHAYVTPNEVVLREFKRLVSEEEQLNEDLENLQNTPGQTADGHQVAMLVNAGLAADMGISLSSGADGVGLYRTEVPFISRELFPSSEEQYKIYRQLLSAFAPRPVTMRTLDVGGDKILPYFSYDEENPSLGWRGIRVTLDHPELFAVQVRAMLRASKGFNNLRIMLPMVKDISDVEKSIEDITTVYNELRDEGVEIEFPSIGVMIEVPSAIYQTRLIARRVDFISLGSNDLTQYILAADRNNSRVASIYNHLHPSVLRAMSHVVRDTHAEDKTISICGEMAGDPAAVILLIGMGFDALSMSAARLTRIKWVISHFSRQQARDLLEEVLEMTDPVMIRKRLEHELEKADLGGLIRAGRH
ncbi:MAG: phosphoenolpyruvate--protein phosphotransferase [Gammaproteobacteria bacterium]